MEKYGRLTLGAVPIGDPKDASFNLIDYIINHKIILVENVEVFNQLCKSLNITTGAKIIYYGGNELVHNLNNYIKILKDGTDILVLSDEGTAGMVDPGGFLMVKCKENNIPVKVMSGPSAIIPSVVLAAVGKNFYFHGSSRNNEVRKKHFKILSTYNFPILFFVEDDYVKDFTDDLITFFGADAQVSFCSNLTKPNEFITNQTAGEIFNYITHNNAYGKMTFVVKKSPHQ
jgi:16S rRNA (cytidine1402-2'-O)-methyltransferase